MNGNRVTEQILRKKKSTSFPPQITKDKPPVG